MGSLLTALSRLVKVGLIGERVGHVGIWGKISQVEEFASAPLKWECDWVQGIVKRPEWLRGHVGPYRPCITLASVLSQMGAAGGLSGRGDKI